MIGHDYELVKFESSLSAMKIKRIKQEFGGVCFFEKMPGRLRVTDVTKKALIS